MIGGNNEVRTERKGAVLPIVSNLVLIVFTAAGLWIAAEHYEERMRETSIAENRFLTTEWHLLQELKRETDRQLAEKDREIAALRQEYEQLRRGDESEDRLSELQLRLEQAREEREQILSQRLEAPAESDMEREDETEAESEVPADSAVEGVAVTDSPGESILDDVLERRIQALDEELTTLEREYERSEEDYEERLEEASARAERLSEALTRANEAAAAALEELRRRGAASERREGPSVDDLNTRTLLRALVSTPEIRSEYPNLLESLDRYFEVYAREKRLEGRREAYESAREALQRVIEETEVP